MFYYYFLKKLKPYTVWVTDIEPTSWKFEYLNEYRLPSRARKFEYINKYGMGTRTRLCIQIEFDPYSFMYSGPQVQHF